MSIANHRSGSSADKQLLIVRRHYLLLLLTLIDYESVGMLILGGGRTLSVVDVFRQMQKMEITAGPHCFC